MQHEVMLQAGVFMSTDIESISCMPKCEHATHGLLGTKLVTVKSSSWTKLSLKLHPSLALGSLNFLLEK